MSKTCERFRLDENGHPKECLCRFCKLWHPPEKMKKHKRNHRFGLDSICLICLRRESEKIRTKERSAAGTSRHRAKRSRQAAGIIYIIKNGAFVKFGFTDKWMNRSAQSYLSPAMKLLYTKIAAKEDETPFRDPWLRYRAPGRGNEWFRYEGDLKHYIQGLRSDRRHRVSVMSYKKSIQRGSVVHADFQRKIREAMSSYE